MATTHELRDIESHFLVKVGQSTRLRSNFSCSAQDLDEVKILPI